MIIHLILDTISLNIESFQGQKKRMRTIQSHRDLFQFKQFLISIIKSSDIDQHFQQLFEKLVLIIKIISFFQTP